jgi:hypothetical protein
VLARCVGAPRKRLRAGVGALLGPHACVFAHRCNQHAASYCVPTQGSSSYLDVTNPVVRTWWAEQFSLDKYAGSTEHLYIWNGASGMSCFILGAILWRRCPFFSEAPRLPAAGAFVGCPAANVPHHPTPEMNDPSVFNGPEITMP